MKTLIFELTMPSNNAWNGRWSGDEKCHAKVLRVDEKKANELDGTSHIYNFGDGWVARVNVCISSSRTETIEVKKRSAGFCGYDWMVDEILRFGRILKMNEDITT